MTSSRYYLVPILVGLLLQGCAGSLQPKSNYRPPAGATPMEKSAIDTGELEPRVGHKGDRLGAEVISTEVIGDEQLIEIRVPIDPDVVDQVYVTTPEGGMVRQSRDAQIIQNYENNNVGIWIRMPTREKTGFRLKLIDDSDDVWPPARQQ